MFSFRLRPSGISLGFVILYAASATAFAASGTLEMSAPSYNAGQNLGVLVTTVNRVGGSSGTASVTCKTVSNTAVAGRDFTAVTRSLTWANGDATPKSCDIPISKQALFYGRLFFSVEIAAASGATMGSPAQSTVIIYGAVTSNRVSLSSASYSIEQNAGAVTVTVARTGVADYAKVAYATANSTAIAGIDYTCDSHQQCQALLRYQDFCFGDRDSCEHDHGDQLSNRDD
jgi:hypothetical protein